MWTQLGKMSTGKQNQTSWAGNYTHIKKNYQNKTGNNTLRQTLGKKNKPKHQGLIENSRTLLRLSILGTQKHIRVIMKKKKTSIKQ